MNLEPMKCANCGLDSGYREPLFLQPESGTAVIGRLAAQLLTINSLYELAEVHRKIGELIDAEGSAPPPTGIKSENIKPERPPLPTSREWLEEDGESFDWQDGDCGARTSPPYSCNVLGTHHRHVAATSSGRVIGRWYTDGPFVEAK